MSEIKRVALNTLEPQKVNDKVIKKLCKTARISVILPESNEGYCPEINYKDQLAAVKKKTKLNKDVNSNGNGLENGLDPFEDNDDDVRRIALEMETKYGSGVTGLPKKKRKGKKDDYADIGMGYDESDPFIDNTDGYDEIIPHKVTTLHGGFYVNSGALEFKTDDEASSEASSSSSSSDSSSSESENDDKKEPKHRKRILETSAESDSDTASTTQKEKKLKLQSPSVSMQQAIKKKLFSTTKIQVKKQKSLEQHKRTVKELLKEKREDLNMTVPDELKTVEDNIEKESSKENKKPMSITSVTDAIESVVKQVVEETNNYDNNQNKQSTDVPSNVSVSDTIDLSETQSNENEMRVDLNKSTKQEEVKLPENLPADITAIVSKLKDAAVNYKGEGKKAFFTKDVNALLLSLEKKSKSALSKSSRVKVYEHISQYVNCTKDTLTRRARLLELEECEKRLVNLKIKLKDSIDSVMPALMASYEQESQKILQKKFSKESAENEELKALKLPRRSFQWSEEDKKVVRDILGVKKRCLIIEGKHKDNLEEQIVNFLRTVVLPLWPEGWMYLNNLKKVYNSMRENSKNKNPSSSLSKENSGAMKASKHSNLSIMPVTNGKNNAEKIEISSSITVTKVSPDVKTNESLKPNTITSDKNHSITSTNPITETDTMNVPNVQAEKPKQLDYSNKPKSSDALPVFLEKPSELSVHPKKNEVFKPYANEPAISQVQKLLTDKEIPQNVQKQTKYNDMFKPYADAVSSADKNIPDESKASAFNDSFSTANEIIQQYLEKEKHSHSHSEKNKHNSHSEREKYNSYTYSDKEKHSSHSYSGKERHSSHTYSDKEKHSSHSYSDKDRHSSHSYSDKDKHSSHSHSDRDKHNSHSHSDRDKYSSRSYAEKDKHTSRGYSERDKQITQSYSSKDKHTSHSERKSEEKTEKPSPRLENSKTEKNPDTSKNPLEKPRDLSKFQMFKPYSETPKPHGLTKSLQQMNETKVKEDKKDLNPVLPKAVHCQGVNLTDKRKILDPYSRSPAEINPANFFPVATSKLSDYSTSPQIVSSKSDGDGQKDIQMVMENLKALQKLSCSPVKNNDNSSSTPVSVITYNKTFTTPKISSGISRSDSDSRSELPGGFQDEFQRQFINSLQQMAANSSNNKSGYNNGS